MMDAYFDERNAIWIKIIKLIAIASFAVLAIIGLVEFVDVNFNTGYALWDPVELFIVRITPCRWFLFAFIELSVSMATINFLNNVQIIREKLEQQQ